MTVIVLAVCPVGLRGHLTRWMLEISSGVFVGHVSARVRDLIWEQITGSVKGGRALMIFSARNEQRLAFRTHNAEWEPTDFDGIHLMKRFPERGESGTDATAGWSAASKRRRYGRGKQSFE